MIKFVYGQKSKKGFTLVELVIGMALTAIILAAVFGFAGPVTELARRAQKNANVEEIHNAVQNQISGLLRNAKDIKIYKNQSVDDAAAILGDSALSDTSKALIFKYVASASGNENYYGKSVYIFSLTDPKSESANWTYYLGSDAGALKMAAKDGEYRLFNDDFYSGFFWTFDITPRVYTSSAGTDIYTLESHIASYDFKTAKGASAISGKSLYEAVNSEINTSGIKSNDETDMEFQVLNASAEIPVTGAFAKTYSDEWYDVSDRPLPLDSDSAKIPVIVLYE